MADSGQTTEGPGQTTVGPGQTTEGPEQTTVGPGQTTEGPGQTTVGPGQTTEGPGQTTEGPGQTTARIGRKVLIAIDGSKHSIFAFEYYAENIHKTADDVVLGFCSEIGTHLSAGAVQTSPATLHALIEKHEGKATKIFEKFDELATKYNIQHTLERLHDPPGPSVVKYAHDNDVKLIVAGSRGHGTLRRTILGSVSDYIVHHSHVPVVICKHHDEHSKLQ